MKNKNLGIILLLAGAALIFWGYNESNSFSSRLGSTLTGSMSDEVMYYYIAGGICAVLGLLKLKK